MDDKAQVPELLLEDLSVGQEFIFGDYVMTQDEIIDFARKFDPQPFHIDPVAAAAHPIFRGLCASGMHTMCAAQLLHMRGFNESGIWPLAGAGSEKLRLYLPVYPGDVLRVRVRVTELRRLKSRIDRGILGYTMEVLNQDDAVVMTNDCALFLGRRQEQTQPS